MFDAHAVAVSGNTQRNTKACSSLLVLIALLTTISSGVHAQLTTPTDFFGHAIGADYVLPNYQQLSEYWKILDGQSDRMTLVDIGQTAENRTQYMAIVTSPSNHQNLDRYRLIARRLARAEGLTDSQALELAKEGKAVVWIDGGLHATEVLGAQQLMETLWQMVSATDEETMRILDEVIILFVHANPDGHDLVADWYMRSPNPTERSTSGVPRLYQKYVGHDNNRDFFASTQPESENMNRVLYHEWYPQIMYNHHQTGPQGTVMFAPPFRDPFNYNFDPLVITGIDLVGSAMHNRFVAEGKPGVVRRRGANYSTWWNGGLRTTVYFHNMIGLLTETIGNPTPIEIPFVLERILPNEDMPYPIRPQPWRFRQSINYSVTANKAVLDVAARYRETFLYNIYVMGRNSIERGSRDTWTTYPKRIEALRESLQASSTQSDFASVMGGFGGLPGPASNYDGLEDPALRDPRAYIMSSDQPDFSTATKFVNALLENGITVHRATAGFSVGTTNYPADSYIVLTAQAFRPHILDMFEPQDHPNDFAFPGSPPTPPYDNAGWTLAYQMGVEFDRVLEAVEGPFERIDEWNTSPHPGTVTGGTGTVGYMMDHRANDAFRVINRLQSANAEVLWLTQRTAEFDAGTFYIPAGRGVRELLERSALELGIDFTGVTQQPASPVLRTRPVRIALADQFGGSMPSGWVRWILEQWEFPNVDVVYPPQLDEDNLGDKYDAIILPDGALQDGSPFARFFGNMPDSIVQVLLAQFGFGPPDPTTLPEEWRGRLGQISDSATVPKFLQFLEGGGTIITIGSSTGLGAKLGLPISDALVETDENGNERPLGQEKYYVPGSVLRTRVNSDALIAHGLNNEVDIFFDNSPVYRLGPDAERQGVTAVAWFDTPEPLRSGWAWGQEYLDGAVSVLTAQVGAGHLYMFGPKITFRAQPHGTFKFLFNGLILSTAEEIIP